MSGPSLRHARPDGAFRKRGPLGHPLDDHSYGIEHGTDSPGAKPHPTKPPAFPKIPRSEFYRNLNQRYRDPSTIDQATSSLCGPASLMFVTATHRPPEFRRFVTELYEYGESKLGDLKIKPGKDCRNVNPSPHVAPADWVALASIRDSENLIFDYDDVDDQVGGITIPSTLAGWFRKAHYKSVLNEANIYLTKGEANFRDAVRLHGLGFRVCFLIRAVVIQEAPFNRGAISQVFTIPNHWVVLNDKNVQMSGSSVRFKIFTWGDGQYQVPISGTLSMENWLDNYYGFVACKP